MAWLTLGRLSFVSDRPSFFRWAATEWQRIGNQIEAALIFTRADFVYVHCMTSDFETSAVPFAFVVYRELSSPWAKQANLLPRAAMSRLPRAEFVTALPIRDRRPTKRLTLGAYTWRTVAPRSVPSGLRATSRTLFPPISRGLTISTCSGPGFG